MSDPSKRGKATSDPVRIERDGELTIVAFDSPPLKLFDERLARGLEEATRTRVGRQRHVQGALTICRPGPAATAFGPGGWLGLFFAHADRIHAPATHRAVV